MRKQNKRAAKRKMQLDNLYALVQAPAIGSTAFLLSCLACVSCFGSFAPLLSCLGSFTHLLPLFAYPITPTALLSYLMLASVPRSTVVLLLLPVLSPTPPHLVSITVRTFKQVLSDKLLCRRSTTPIEFFHPFPPFNLLPDKTNRKRTCDIAFNNSRQIAGNHD